MLNAIILAGEQKILSSNDISGDISNKALLRINERAMVEYVVDVIRKVNLIDRIVVVGPVAELNKIIGDRVDAVIEDTGEIMQNVTAGIKSLNSDEFVLVATSDIPMISVEAVEDFIKRSIETKVDFCYPIIEKKYNDDKFPGIRRTYTRMREGNFTGGNIFYVSPSIALENVQLAQKFIAARKNPLRMARILGLRFVFQLAVGTLTIRKVEEKFSEIFGIKAKAIISSYPEVGNDVDKPEDLVFAMAYLSRKA